MTTGLFRPRTLGRGGWASSQLPGSLVHSPRPVDKHGPVLGQYGEGAFRRTQRETRLGIPHLSPRPRAKASHRGAAPLPRALGAVPGSCQGRFGPTLVPSKRPSPALGDRKFLEQVGRVPQICSQKLWNRSFHGKGQRAWVPSHSKAGVFSLFPK